MMSDMVPPQIPLVLHLLLTDLAVHLPPHRVHVQDVLMGGERERGAVSMAFLRIITNLCTFVLIETLEVVYRLWGYGL